MNGVALTDIKEMGVWRDLVKSLVGGEHRREVIQMHYIEGIIHQTFSAEEMEYVVADLCFDVSSPIL